MSRIGIADRAEGSSLRLVPLTGETKSSSGSATGWVVAGAVLAGTVHWMPSFGATGQVSALLIAVTAVLAWACLLIFLRGRPLRGFPSGMPAGPYRVLVRQSLAWATLLSAALALARIVSGHLPQHTNTVTTLSTVVSALALLVAVKHLRQAFQGAAPPKATT